MLQPCKALGGLAQEQKLLLALVVGAFLPFYFTVPILLAVFIGVMANPNNRKSLFAPKYAVAIPLFCGFTAVVAVWFQNWFGLLVSVAFYCILSLHAFVRRFITPKLLVYVLRSICLLSGACGAAAMLDFLCKVLLLKTPMAVYRCQLWFFNPNYLATMLVAGVLVCSYLLFTAQVSKKHALPCLVLQLMGVYFTGSAFSLVAMAVGVCGLLLFVRRVRPWIIALLLLGAAIVFAAVVPLVLARWNEMEDTLRFRIDIWAAAIEDIGKHFLFGRGCFGYFQMSLQNSALYPTTHAHNLVLDSVLNYGLVGCGLALGFFVPYFKEVWRRWRAKDVYCGFLLAALAAVLVHSMVDMTMLWVQTGLLGSVLMGCIGGQMSEVV